MNYSFLAFFNHVCCNLPPLSEFNTAVKWVIVLGYMLAVDELSLELCPSLWLRLAYDDYVTETFVV
jgi:hypothetical protein